MSKHDKFQHSWSSKREMVIAYTALTAVITVALAMVVFLLWGVVYEFLTVGESWLLHGV